MSPFTTHHAIGAKLSPEDQVHFDAILGSMGINRAAALLKCGDTLLDRLRGGGHANPRAVERIAVRLRELRVKS